MKNYKLQITNYKLRNKGFTLIEVLIYLAIVGIALSSFVAFVMQISDVKAKNYVMEEAQANARIALDIISRKIKSANGVNTALSTFDADPGELSLSMSDSSKNPTVFNLTEDDGILQITQGADDPVAITSDEVKITSLVFTNLSAGSDFENIRIQLTVEYNNLGSDIEYAYSQNYQTTVSLRQ